MSTRHRDGGFGDRFETDHARIRFIVAFLVRYLLQRSLQNFLLQVDIMGHEIDTRLREGGVETG